MAGSLVHRGTSTAVLDHVGLVPVPHVASAHVPYARLVKPVGVLVSHFDLGRGYRLALDVEGLDPFLQIHLILHPQSFSFSLDLLLNKVVSLSLKLSMHFPPDVIHLLLLVDSGVVLVLEQHKILGQLFTALLLLDQALILLLELEVNLLLFGKATDGKMATRTFGLKMSRHIGEERVDLRGWDLVRLVPEEGSDWHVVPVEDFVFAL